MSSTMPTTLDGGRYQLGQLIGRGGMAEVHVALDTRLGRTVAIKIMRPDLAHDDVGGAVHARRDFRRGDVGDHQQRLAQAALDVGQLTVYLRDAVADLAHLLLGGGYVAAFLGNLADFLGSGVALRLKRLRLAHERPAFRVEIARLFQYFTFDPAPRKRGGGGVEVLPQLLNVNHVRIIP